MSLSIWQNCCPQYRSLTSCLQEQWPNARLLGSGLCSRNVPFHWARTWNFRNFKPEFLLNGKRPIFTLYRIVIVRTRKTLRYSMNNNGRQLEQVVHTHIEHHIMCVAQRVWLSGSQSLILNIYFRLSGLQSSFLRIHLRYGPNTCSHYTKVWHWTCPICDAPLSRSARRSLDLLHKSPRNHR